MLTRRVGSNAIMFGEHEEGTLRQLVDVSQRAERTALLADGHVGFTMPIGGVAAYRNKVSVVGVGFDIACLAAGTPVATADGFTRPIEAVADSDPVVCWDGAAVRPVAPHFGAVPRGEREVLAITLGNGRKIRATPDHEILTRAGWKRADELGTEDSLACTPFIGLPYEAPTGEIQLDVENPRSRAELAERGLLPLRASDPRFPALVRLLAYVSGDGHLSKDGKRVSAYVFNDTDAAGLAADFRRLGFEPKEHRRWRKEGWREEINLYVGSTALHALFAALGSPVGKKDWAAQPMPWLMGMPAWVRALYLSSFGSAEMMTPRIHRSGTIPNLQLKQSGRHRHAIDFVADLLQSLGFEVSVAPSGRQSGDRVSSVLQILGGQAEQLRFMRDVGFCHSVEKRVRAAAAASVAWQGQAYAANRDAAKQEARALRGQGVPWRTAVADVAERFGVTPGFAYHSFYDARGRSRRLPGEAVEPRADGEICWVPVARVEPDGTSLVYDVVTGDPAHCFLASGVVVHNCGNAAIRTDLRVEDITRNVSLDEIVRNPHRLAQNNLANNLADEIASTISFGIGRKNNADDAPVDHPLFRDPAWFAVPNTGGYRDTLQDKARRQLGTVGSGNHYVDVFADESGTVWVGVHFGSRGLGHTIASAFLSLSQGGMWGERAAEKEVLLDLDRPIGHDYWQLMQLAGEYAYAGREWVARKVVALLGGTEQELVHNHHNFGWKETHVSMDGEPTEYVVIRKGATPAFPGQKGFVGGSMGDDAVILEGNAAPPDEETARAQREALFSTVHGAGRVMSRTQAAGKRNRRGKVLVPGRISQEMVQQWLGKRGVILRGGGLDEAPQAYRRLPKVLEAQGDTIQVRHTLRPLIVAMAGAGEVDPYKD
ncbi:MAG: RNA-2',3'-PO4:RNA-5'-OH ligase [uncultured Gemmatimonadetes bacterium]|uniref:3'-phosphate/5'-hydroxy nucleic acid ligase n=1 Tax=uncultured Gemmatimonadota bacterium TaxID=203437 RepID=A0A6J4L2V1_9BACT|nr:MAG: RNA-2',3'-PO4:RNA-5'-OH ligase [uncultured Gemmatimonadota bacterium]